MEINFERIYVIENAVVIEFKAMFDTINAVDKLLTYYGSRINGDNMEVTVSSIKIFNNTGGIDMLRLLAHITNRMPLVMA